MIKILCADALEGLRTLSNDSVSMCVTSPPYYGLRDYGNVGQIGIEDSPEQYIQKLTAIFREVRRVLQPDGTLWLNIADSYAGSGKGIGRKPTHCKHSYQIPADSAAAAMPTTWNAIKPKDMIGIPWMLAFALRADGWYLRSDIIWNKINCLPESVKDRPTKSYEHLFLFAKSSRYYYNAAAIMEPTAESSLKTIRSWSLWSKQIWQIFGTGHQWDRLQRTNAGKSHAKQARCLEYQHQLLPHGRTFRYVSGAVGRTLYFGRLSRRWCGS